MKTLPLTEALQETLAVLSDTGAVDELREAAESKASGETFTTDEVLQAFAQRRHTA